MILHVSEEEVDDTIDWLRVKVRGRWYRSDEGSSREGSTLLPTGRYNAEAYCRCFENIF